MQRLKSYVKGAVTTIAFGLIFEEVALSQKQTSSVQQAWFGYLTQTRLSKRWGLWFDAHLRTKEDFFTNFSTSIVRPGVTYYFADNSKLTVGYGWINNFPGDIHPNVLRPEHRIWQQYQWLTKYQRVRTSQYIRLEERYRRKILNDQQLAEGYNFNYRLRYNFLMTVPLGNLSSSKWSVVFNDEAMVNFGKEVVNNYFDQNRFFVGFAYNTNSTDNLQFGYLNVFSQLAAGNRYRSIHAPRIYYNHNLDLRKKK